MKNCSNYFRTKKIGLIGRVHCSINLKSKLLTSVHSLIYTPCKKFHDHVWHDLNIDECEERFLCASLISEKNITFPSIVQTTSVVFSKVGSFNMLIFIQKKASIYSSDLSVIRTFSSFSSGIPSKKKN